MNFLTNQIYICFNTLRMKNLVIVESPAKSKTIEKYLGKDYKVVSSKGHIRDLATRGPEGLGVDIENDFKATYSIPRKKNDIIKSLKADVKECDFVYLATDPDREGEAISWHLAEVLGLDINQENRITFNEITKNAVNEVSEVIFIDLGLSVLPSFQLRKYACSPGVANIVAAERYEYVPYPDTFPNKVSLLLAIT